MFRNVFHIKERLAETRFTSFRDFSVKALVRKIVSLYFSMIFFDERIDWCIELWQLISSNSAIMLCTRSISVIQPVIFRTINLGLKMPLYDGKIVYPILVLENYNFEMSKKGVLGFSISWLVLEIFRFLT